MIERIARIDLQCMDLADLKPHPRNPRCQAKVICLPLASGDNFVIEGSANLRSSDNTEQLVIFNDAETLAFHTQWMNDLKKSA